MTSLNESPRTSFFDDDDLSIKFEFQKTEKIHNHKELISSQQKLMDQIFLKNSAKNTFQQGYYGLIKRFIVYYKVNTLTKSLILISFIILKL